MGKKLIQGGKEINIGVGKETHTGWEGNAYRVWRKHIHGGKEMHTLTDNIYPYKMKNKTFEFKIYQESSSKYLKIKRKKNNNFILKSFS